MKIKNATPLEWIKYMEEDLGLKKRSGIKAIITIISLTFALTAGVITEMIMPHDIKTIILDFIVAAIVFFFIQRYYNKEIRTQCNKKLKEILPDFNYMNDLDCKVLSKTIDKVIDEDYLGDIKDLIRARFLELKKIEEKKIQDVQKILKKETK